jgi:hypothetical protein
MADRRELDRLIEAALADNKLTSKEMEVLVRKAKQLGIDEDEFLIELGAKQHLKKRKAKSDKSKKLLEAVKKGDSPKAALFGFLGLLLIAGLCFGIYGIIEWVQTSKVKKFDEAILKYDFQKAYSLLAKFSETDADNPELSERALKTQQLLKAAIPYYLKNNQPQAAIDALNEYQFELTVKPHKNFFYRNAERQAYNTEAQFYNLLWFDIAYYLVKNGQINEGIDIVNLKLVPYTNDNSDPTFEPIQEIKDNFQKLVNGLNRK